MWRWVLGVMVAMVWAGAASARTETAVFAGGCFWCVEANFESVPGVRDVISGYTGGTSANPTYDDHEGHYEAVQITFVPPTSIKAEPSAYGEILGVILALRS